MAKRRSTERHIYFPWERRGGIWRRIRIDQARYELSSDGPDGKPGGLDRIE